MRESVPFLLFDFTASREAVPGVFFIFLTNIDVSGMKGIRVCSGMFEYSGLACACVCDFGCFVCMGKRLRAWLNVRAGNRVCEQTNKWLS